MPLGWYLAQGLYPLGPSSSDDEEGPCELPDGRIVCGPHGLKVCGICCTDYTDLGFDEDGLDEDDDADYDDEPWPPGGSGGPFSFWSPSFPGETPPTPPGRRFRRGIGQVLPTKFTPPSLSIAPLELYNRWRVCGSLYRSVTPILHYASRTARLKRKIILSWRYKLTKGEPLHRPR